MIALLPRTNFFIFTVVVTIVFFLGLDLVNIHLPFVAIYAAVLIALVLHVLLARIQEKLRRKVRD